MINVVCLKHGEKFGAQYVNNLFSMVSRHLCLKHDFYCFTEDASSLNQAINVVPLPSGVFQGWWWKPYLFKKGHFPDGDVIFYIDLDMVILKNMDKFFTTSEGKFMGLQDPGSRMRSKPFPMLGSAVMRWQANQYSDIWEGLEKNPELTTKFRGDQNYIYKLHKKEIIFYPDNWIRSYKWEVRKMRDLTPDKSAFKEIKDPPIHVDTAILAFHGKPMVHEVKDPVIVNNWL